MQRLIQQLHASQAAKVAPAGNDGDAGQTRAGTWFGFFVEPTYVPDDGQPEQPKNSQPTKRTWIQFPESGIAYLRCSPGQLPRVDSTAPETAGEAVALEPVHHQGHSFLVMQRPGREVRINSLPAQRIAVLHVGDRITVGDDCVLHVSLLVRPYVGPCLEEHVDQKCAYCRSGFSRGSIVYVCPRCRHPTHCEGEERPLEARLECAKLASECPRCHQPVVMKEEVTYVPD